jgi:hypothetical protein
MHNENQQLKRFADTDKQLKAGGKQILSSAVQVEAEAERGSQIGSQEEKSRESRPELFLTF